MLSAATCPSSSARRISRPTAMATWSSRITARACATMPRASRARAYTTLGARTDARAPPARSFLDIFTLSGFTPRPLKYVSKIEILDIPLIGWAMRWAGHIAIRRGDRRSQLETFKDTVASLKAGNAVVTFAEGTRSTDGRLANFKAGPFKMAINAGVDIVPVSLVNIWRWCASAPPRRLSSLRSLPSRDRAFGSQVPSDGARAHRAPARRGDSRAPSRQDCRPEGGRRPLRSLRGGQQRSPYRPASVAGGRGVELAQACRPPRLLLNREVPAKVRGTTIRRGVSRCLATDWRSPVRCPFSSAPPPPNTPRPPPPSMGVGRPPLTEDLIRPVLSPTRETRAFQSSRPFKFGVASMR